MKDMSMIQSGLKIIKDDGGLNALLAGLGPTTFGYLFEGAIKFGIYEVSKPLVGRLLTWSAALCKLPWIDSKMLGFVISGGIAGTAASVMLCPMEALRIRLVAEPELAAVGWIDGGLSMIGNEGIKGFWKSFPAMLSKQVPYTITKNVSFDLITTMSYTTVAAYGLTICSKWKLVIPLLSAMLASILSCISSQPGDMLLSVVNAEEGKKSTSEFARDIMKRDGFAGFFVGVRERFLHVGIIVTMQLLIYDFVKRLVGISATGL
jgi:solute carrier family 25 phosphate transporter 3